MTIDEMNGSGNDAIRFSIPQWCCGPFSNVSRIQELASTLTISRHSEKFDMTIVACDRYTAMLGVVSDCLNAVASRKDRRAR